MEWDKFDNFFHELYCYSNGRPAKPIRLMVGLHYLKYTYNLSNKDVVCRRVENPYWQFFFSKAINIP
ncbi:MAG: transposase [Candidatus Zixiibacteriota bacterium]